MVEGQSNELDRKKYLVDPELSEIMFTKKLSFKVPNHETILPNPNVPKTRKDI